MNDVLAAISSLLSTALTTTYKKYFIGRNKVAAYSHMPCIEIIPLGTEVVNKTTGGGEESTYTIQVNIISSLKKHLQDNRDVTTVESTETMVDRMEERESNGTPKSATVLGVLSENLGLSNSVTINGDWGINYEESDLGESWLLIASLTFSATHLTP